MLQIPTHVPLLEARGLSKSYGATVALHDANVRVEATEVVAITGPSGSGKSTLLHCLAGILCPDSGEVHFAGSRLDNASESHRSELRRRRFGILFQFGGLVSELTAVENVALPLLLDGKCKADAFAAAMHWMERFAVSNLAKSRLGEVSGGESQRIAMARALVAEPSVVFADEPTGSLDAAAGELVLSALLGVARESGSSVVIVTHNPSVAERADRTVMVRDGRLLDGAVFA